MDILLLGVFAVLLGLVIAACGAAMIVVSLSRVREGRRSRGWPAVPARVLSSVMEVRQRQSGDGDGSFSVYDPSIRYSYEVAGKAYESTRVRFGNQERLSETTAKEVLAQYPAGAETVAYVDPDRPSQAVLDRETPTVLWGSMAFGAVILAGALVFTGWAVGEFFL